MRVEVSAPNRIDLAGGTTDLYPLYLLMHGGCTVNVAINVPSRVTLLATDDYVLKLCSEDLRESFESTNLDDLPTSGPLGLLGLTLRQFPPPKGLNVTTNNAAPPGSGLGASSALTVALIIGLLKIRDEELSPTKIVQMAADIETALIGVPTGKQDHIAALYGGVSLIHFGFDGYQRRGFHKSNLDLDRLQEMTILSYTGAGRFSGMNNWEITKNFIDGDHATKTKLMEIRKVAIDTCKIVEIGDWEALGPLVNKEWNIRRSLAPGVSNPTIDSMISAAKSAGAVAGKVCGAGGGGCMITITPSHKRSAVEKALADQGATIMNYEIDSFGVKTSSSEEL
ncbi:MAG: GHMP kinase [Deltaproteobacteria bacterium]|nr:GHMP kinase [Deltaproteobacteria bacterium]